MQAEIIAVGTEILLGQIVNTNATYIAKVLADLGIETYYQTVVGDNPKRLKEVIKTADSRSQLVILCGGLGPTKDDLTKEVVAKYLDIDLVYDKSAMDKIVNRFETLDIVMTENNKKQANILAGGLAIPNETGLAAGSFYERENHHYLLLPGPPNELIPMMENSVRQLLTEKFRQDEVLTSRVLRFFGIGESKLVTLLQDLIDQQTNPTIAPYAKTNEVTLRLTASAKTEGEANRLLDETEKQVLNIAGEYFYGYGDDNSLANVVVELLKEKNLTITSAESLTAGKFQSTIANISGASQIFTGGFVTYALETKAKMLGISVTDLEKYGTVSEFCAKEMAKKAREILNTDLAISFTGVAGPEELEGQTVGTVWIGYATRESMTAEKYRFIGDRQTIRNRAVMTGLDLVRKRIK